MKYGTTHAVLKPLEEVLLADPRFELAVLETESEIRPFELADLHERLCLSKLNSEVPSDVATQFQTALNLMLYTWFVYEFQTVAEQHAYAALEFALRKRFPQATRPSKSGKAVPLTLGPLLRKAMTEGLIVAETFPAWKRMKEQSKYFDSVSPFPREPMLTANEWVTKQIERLPRARNELAHGSPKLWMFASFLSLELCADLINALFPNAENKVSANER